MQVRPRPSENTRGSNCLNCARICRPNRCIILYCPSAFAVIVVTFARRIKVTSGSVAAAIPHKNPSPIVNVTRFIAFAYIILSLRRGEQKGQNPPREVLGSDSGKPYQNQFRLDCSSQFDSAGRVLFTADAFSGTVAVHCSGRRKTQRVESAIRGCSELV